MPAAWPMRLGMRSVFLHPLAGVLSAFGMGLAELRALREVQFDAPLVGRRGSRGADRGAGGRGARRACGARRRRGPRSTRPAHLRYDGSHQSLPVPFGTAADDAGRLRGGASGAVRLYLARAGGPVRDAGGRGRGRGRGRCRTCAPVPGAGQPVDRLRVWVGRRLARRCRFTGARLAGRDTRIAGPAVIGEATGTVVVEPGWEARVDGQAQPDPARGSPPWRGRRRRARRPIRCCWR